MSEDHELPEPDDLLREAYGAVAFEEEAPQMKTRVWAKVSRDVGSVAAAASLGGWLQRGFELSPMLKWKVFAAALGVAIGGAALGVTVDRLVVGRVDVSEREVDDGAIEPRDGGSEDAGNQDAGNQDAGNQDAGTDAGADGGPRVRVVPSPRRDAGPPPLAPSQLARERAMIDAVRAAVRASNHQEALRTIERHAREFQNGRLVEEREGLRVVALVRMGRAEEARRRARRFRTRFPRSLLLPLIDAALEEGAP